MDFDRDVAAPDEVVEEQVVCLEVGDLIWLPRRLKVQDCNKPEIRIVRSNWATIHKMLAQPFAKYWRRAGVSLVPARNICTLSRCWSYGASVLWFICPSQNRIRQLMQVVRQVRTWFEVSCVRQVLCIEDTQNRAMPFGVHSLNQCRLSVDSLRLLCDFASSYT